MKPRIHSSLLLLVTLIIGMILGALIQSNLHSKRVKHFGIIHNEERFVTALTEAIQPADEAQAEAVTAILKETAERVIPMVRKNFEAFRLEMEQMQESLQPLLDADQYARLQKRMKPPGYRGNKKD